MSCWRLLTSALKERFYFFGKEGSIMFLMSISVYFYYYNKTVAFIIRPRNGY